MLSAIIGACLAEAIRPRVPKGVTFSKKKPWKDCPECKGRGKIEINYKGSGDFVECPCTMEVDD